MNPAEAYISIADYAPGLGPREGMARSEAHSFTPLLSTFAGDRWRKGSEGIFTQVWTTGENPQGEAGFKIRLAAHPAIADEVLRTAVPIIVGAGCPFKVIANTALLGLACSKWSSGESAGDFMTVYPPSQALFDDLTEKLKHAIHGIKASDIPMPLTKTSGRTTLTPDSPWPGLDYFWPNESPYFFGCEDEQLELAQRLERAMVTVVLGQGGVGKSSLLRAGLTPLFDRLSCEPVYLRLHCGSAVHPVQQVRDEINRVLTERKIDGAPFGEGQTLWEYFHLQKPGWVAAGGKPVVPVLIFDQFEDVLGFDRAARRPVEALWTQIANLVENRGREAARTERNGFKVVISLRQDHLPKLLARRGQMPSITQNHFLLKPFNGSKAVRAVLGPGKGLLDPANPDTLAEEIVRRVGRETTQSSDKPIAAGKAIESLDNLRVDPALLSFFCQQLNEARKRSHQEKPEASLITAELVNAEAGRIFEDFLQPGDKTPNALPATEPPTTVQATEPPTTVQATEPPTTVQTTEPPTTVQATEPPTTVQATEPPTTVQATEPPTLVQAPEPPTTVQAPEPPTTVQATEPATAVQAKEPPTTIQATEPPTTVKKEPQEPEVKKLPGQKSEHPVKAPLPAEAPAQAGRRLKNVAFGLVILLIIIFSVMIVTYFEDLQREQTEVELEEFISNLAAAKNTFTSAHRKIALDESNLALKESNLLALIEQTRQEAQETQAAKEQYSRLAGEETNSQSRIIQLNGEKAQAEFRLAQWSSLLNDLTNQIASLAREKEELEARNHALTVTNHALAVTHHAPAVTNDADVLHLSRNRLATPDAADEKQAAAMESLPEKLPAAITPDIERSARRNANVLLTHGQCVYSEDGTNIHTLELHQVLRQGAVILTGKRSWCDIFIRRAGITVRLAPESQIKIAKLSLASQNGVPLMDTLLELPYGRIFTVVRALVPGSTLEISDAAGRSVIEGGGLGSYMINAPRPGIGDKLSLTPLRIINEQGTSIIAPGQEYSAKDGTTFSLAPSTWETTLIHLDELEAEADRAIAEPEPPKSPKNN